MMTMTQTKQIEELRQRYAEMIVEGMDMDNLITFAVESIVENLKGYEIDDIKEEIIDCYGAETWFDLNP
jgi:hypothetical protein